MKKIVSIFGILAGISLIYFGVLIFVSTTSDNKSEKNYTYIAPVEAKLKFFEDTESAHPYGEKSSMKYSEADLYNQEGKFWTSEKSPVEEKYSKVTVLTELDPEPVPKPLQEAVEKITRYSH